MSLVRDIKEAFETQIEETLTSYSKSKYKWSIEQNNKANSSSVYAVRVNSAGTISGTTQTITQARTFDVILSTKFKNKGDNDDNLDEQIMVLCDDHESLQVVLFRRKLNLARVLLVQAIDISEPDIDNENNIVTMTATYTVNFRLGV